MSINQVIHEFDNTVLETHNFLSLRIEIERHVFISLDVQESHIDSEEWIEERLFLEVSPPVG